MVEPQRALMCHELSGQMVNILLHGGISIRITIGEFVALLTIEFEGEWENVSLVLVAPIETLVWGDATPCRAWGRPYTWAFVEFFSKLLFGKNFKQKTVPHSIAIKWFALWEVADVENNGLVVLIIADREVKPKSILLVARVGPDIQIILVCRWLLNPAKISTFEVGIEH